MSSTEIVPVDRVDVEKTIYLFKEMELTPVAQTFFDGEGACGLAIHVITPEIIQQYNDGKDVHLINNEVHGLLLKKFPNDDYRGSFAYTFDALVVQEGIISPSMYDQRNGYNDATRLFNRLNEEGIEIRRAKKYSYWNISKSTSTIWHDVSEAQKKILVQKPSSPYLSQSHEDAPYAPPYKFIGVYPSGNYSDSYTQTSLFSTTSIPEKYLDEMFKKNPCCEIKLPSVA